MGNVPPSYTILNIKLAQRVEKSLLSWVDEGTHSWVTTTTHSWVT